MYTNFTLSIQKIDYNPPIPREEDQGTIEVTLVGSKEHIDFIISRLTAEDSNHIRGKVEV